MYVCVIGINVASFKMQYIAPRQEIERSCICVLGYQVRTLSGHVCVCYGYQCCLYLRFVLLDYEAVSKVCYFLVYFGIF
jgi:hypothetical protein